MTLRSSIFIPYQCLSDQIGWVYKSKADFFIYFFIFFSSHQLHCCKYPGSRHQAANSRHPAVCFLTLISSPIIEGLHAKPSWQASWKGTQKSTPLPGPSRLLKPHLHRELVSYHTGRARPQRYTGLGPVESQGSFSYNYIVGLSSSCICH